MHSLDGFGSYIKDSIDILIVSYIIYQILILLRGSRAFQLLKGVTVIVAIWLISNFLHLGTLRWLIENFFSVGLIAVIIIFQPELRRALEQLGRGGFFRSQQVEEQFATKVVSEITKTVSHFSENRIGALIVVEMETGLSDYIETGIKLEAKLSSELLKNIFFPKTPLHDGAVIIRNGCIMAAGCYLPLTESPMISKELGTRHRAGIGITEISDAMVIIVSEETGQISLAIHGQLQRDIDEEELLSQLYEAIKPPKKTSASFWKRRGKGEKDE